GLAAQRTDERPLLADLPPVTASREAPTEGAAAVILSPSQAIYPDPEEKPIPVEPVRPRSAPPVVPEQAPEDAVALPSKSAPPASDSLVNLAAAEPSRPRLIDRLFAAGCLLLGAVYSQRPTEEPRRRTQRRLQRTDPGLYLSLSSVGTSAGRGIRRGRRM